MRGFWLLSLRRQFLITLVLLVLPVLGVALWTVLRPAGDRSAGMLGVAVLGAGVAGWLVAAAVLSRRIGDATRHLERAARRVARGDYGALEQHPAPSREFADLQGAFASMLQRLHESRRRLDAQIAEERRTREARESLHGQMIRQERLAAVGQLVSGVAHEINNPLQAILGFAELLQLQPDVPDQAKADLEIIQKESTRASGIIRSLAQFASHTPNEVTPFQLAEIVRGIERVWGRRLETGHIQLTIEDRSTQHVTAVPGDIEQVVLNLMVNAEQAMIEARRVPGRITIRTFDRDAAVVLEVEDTGPGVPVDLEARLFQPFFTTKRIGQGTGLGLAVSYGIIVSLGGRIGYRRAPAGGALFSIEVPAAGPS